MKAGLIFLVVFGFHGVVFSAGKSIPKVLEVSGKPQVMAGSETTFRPVKKNEVYQEKAQFRLAAGDILEIVIQEGRRLKVSGKASFEFPGIRFETGEAPVVKLNDGRLRWIAQQGVSDGTRLVSPFFDLVPGQGEFLVEISAEKAFAEMLVLNGEIHFRPLNFEEERFVKARQKVRFQGVVEDGEIAYDLLLKGRKIPRGKLGAVGPLQAEELRPFLEEEMRIKKALAQKKLQEKKKLIEDEKANRICQKPAAEYQSCAWFCEGGGKKGIACPWGSPGVQCVQKRCNANGEWADSQVLSEDLGRQLCKNRTQTGTCQLF